MKKPILLLSVFAVISAAKGDIPFSLAEFFADMPAEQIARLRCTWTSAGPSLTPTEYSPWAKMSGQRASIFAQAPIGPLEPIAQVQLTDATICDFCRQHIAPDDPAAHEPLSFKFTAWNAQHDTLLTYEHRCS